MRRIGNLWPQVVAFENLEEAALRAARGKRDRHSTAVFLDRLEPEILRLERELEAGAYRPGRPVLFRIFDPKERVIAAAPFRDRVVHHALIAILEPCFERRMRPESFACRKGKGTHAAIRHARRLVRKHGWCLKLDIAKCFDSMPHDVILETVRRIIKDRRVLALIEVIVRANSKDEGAERSPGLGLPIGSLTSQWFANIVLDRLDHFIVEDLRLSSYVRYMDDFVVFADDKAVLGDALARVRDFVEKRLGLRLRDRATLLAPVSEGLPFLGFRIYRGTIRVRPQNLRRSRRRLRARERAFACGEIDEKKLADCVRSIVAYLAIGNTLSLRRKLFA